MRVLVEYSDGSQKVQLDDGREVILSSPYRDGSRKIYGEEGSSGWLTDKYNDGSKRATMDDGTVYSVEEKNFLLFGKQEIWEKIKSGGVSSLSPDEVEEAKSILSSSGTSSTLEQELDTYQEEQSQRIRYEEEQYRYQEEQMRQALLRQQEEEEELRRQEEEDEEDDWLDDDDDEEDDWLDDDEEDKPAINKQKDTEELTHQTIKLSLDDVYKGTEKNIKVGSKTYKVKLKSGLSSGMKVRIGGVLPDNKDYYLDIEIEPESYYFDEFSEISNIAIKGKDLYLDYEIDVFTAALGGEETIYHPLGKINLTIPRQIEPETKISIPGYGLPQYNNSEVIGNLVVTIKVKKAKDKLTAAQRRLLIFYIEKYF